MLWLRDVNRLFKFWDLKPRHLTKKISRCTSQIGDKNSLNPEPVSKICGFDRIIMVLQELEEDLNM